MNELGRGLASLGLCGIVIAALLIKPDVVTVIIWPIVIALIIVWATSA